MLDFSLPFPQIANLLLEEQYKLEKFANQSVLESTENRDLYLKRSLEFVLNNYVDSVTGKFYYLKDNQIIYDPVSNAALACWLLSAGRALYSGELSQWGRLIIESVEREFFDKDKVSFRSSIRFSQTKSPCLLEKNELVGLLSQEEFRLLEGYLGFRIQLDSVECFFKKQLKEATEFSKLFPKQAQILDGPFRDKMTEILSENFNKSVLHIEESCLSQQEEAFIFSCMTQAQVWLQREVTFTSFSMIHEKLLSGVSYAERSGNLELRVSLCYVLLQSLQLEYNEETWSKIKKLKLVDWKLKFPRISEYSKIQCARVLSFLSSLESQFPVPIEENIKKTSNYHLELFSRNERESYLEKYRISQLDVSFPSMPL